MMDSDMTVNDLQLLYKGQVAAASIDMVLAQTHEARVKAVQSAIDMCCNELEKNKSMKQGLSEDQLTLEICGMLKAAGFQASHDKYTNGHCDIVVDGTNGFLWLAESKKHNAYDWLARGFAQLSERYSTGVHGQDCADILIYCFVKDAKSMLTEWRNRLQELQPTLTTSDSSCGNPLIFCSTHQHSASGLDFHIRHKAVCLHWSP